MSSLDTIEFKALDSESFVPEVAVTALLDRALELNASDLFFCAGEDYVDVQVRHLGLIRKLARLDASQGRRSINHIKALAGVPLENRRKPADGRWVRSDVDGRKIDLRLSTVPTFYGEDLALAHSAPRFLATEPRRPGHDSWATQ